MRAFTFDLQAALNQRRQGEDEAQRELARLLREQMVLQTQLRSIRDTVDGDRAVLAPSLAGTLGVARLQRHASFAMQAGTRVGQIVARLADLDRAAASARHRYVEAAKRRKAIERLHDKQLGRWQLARRRREAVEMEESTARPEGVFVMPDGRMCR